MVQSRQIRRAPKASPLEGFFMAQKCSECKWFAYFVNLETGRKKPTEKGICNFPLPWPTVWPAYVDSPPWKPQNRIWDTSGRDCKTYMPSNNRLHLDVGDSPAQQALFTPEADTAEGKLPAPTPRR